MSTCQRTTLDDPGAPWSSQSSLLPNSRALTRIPRLARTHEISPVAGPLGCLGCLGCLRQAVDQRRTLADAAGGAVAESDESEESDDSSWRPGPEIPVTPERPEMPWPGAKLSNPTAPAFSSCSNSIKLVLELCFSSKVSRQVAGLSGFCARVSGLLLIYPLYIAV